jgi:hypothetical protein
MSQSSPVFLITNCTASKKAGGGVVPALSQFSGTLDRKMANWWKACLRAQPKFPARNLYQSDNWLQALRAFELLRSKTDAVQLFVVSAGLGLIPAEEAIPEYSATFAFGDQNSIGSCFGDNQKWWEKLSCRREQEGGVGSITNLAARYPTSVFLIGLGATYLMALLPDLIAARDSMTDSRKMIIVSTGSTKIPALGSSLLPLDARFENKLGGARTTLNSRLLGHIAQNFDLRELRADKVSIELSKELAELAPIRSFDRKRLADEDILKKLKKGIADVPDISASALLRKFRDSGMACESKRFIRLFKQTTTQNLT